MLEIYIDGACAGNPGEAAVGVVLKKGGKTLGEISKPIGKATNNIAEYTALLVALEEAAHIKEKQLKIHTDSELLYHQLIGNYKVKNEKLRPLFDQAQKLGQKFDHLEVKHIPREKNHEADALASQALKKQTKTVASLFKPSGEESPSSGG